MAKNTKTEAVATEAVATEAVATKVEPTKLDVLYALFHTLTEEEAKEICIAIHNNLFLYNIVMGGVIPNKEDE
jgi:hypothetical protein